MSKRNAIIIIVCCPWDEFLNATAQLVPLGISLGVIAALVVSAYEQLLRALE